MERLLSPFSPVCFALLRVLAGLLYASHGAQELFGVLGDTAAPFLSEFGAAGVMEFVLGPLIAAGWLTRCAAFIASGEMAVAYFQFHAPRALWPVQNHGEVPAVYSFLFLYVATRGAVAFGVDARR